MLVEQVADGRVDRLGAVKVSPIKMNSKFDPGGEVVIEAAQVVQHGLDMCFAASAHAAKLAVARPVERHLDPVAISVWLWLIGQVVGEPALRGCGPSCSRLPSSLHTAAGWNRSSSAAWSSCTWLPTQSMITACRRGRADQVVEGGSPRASGRRTAGELRSPSRSRCSRRARHRGCGCGLDKVLTPKSSKNGRLASAGQVTAYPAGDGVGAVRRIVVAFARLVDQGVVNHRIRPFEIVGPNGGHGGGGTGVRSVADTTMW